MQRHKHNQGCIYGGGGLAPGLLLTLIFDDGIFCRFTNYFLPGFQIPEHPNLGIH